MLKFTEYSKRKIHNIWYSTKNSKKIIFLINIWIFFSIIIFSPEIIGNCSHIVPANNKNIIINENQELIIEDTSIVTTNNIIVEADGKLIIRNATIYFNHTKYNDVGIILKENATLQLIYSNIRGLNTLFFFEGYDSVLFIEDSIIRGTHILCYENSNVTIRRSDFWALHCFNESVVAVDDAKLHYLFLRGRASAKVFDSNVVEILLYGDSYAYVRNTTLKNIFYFDQGWTTLLNCNYVDLIRFRPKLCNLTIKLLNNKTSEYISIANVTLTAKSKSEDRKSITNEYGITNFTNVEEGDYLIEIKKNGYQNLEQRISILKKQQNETFFLIEKNNSSFVTEYSVVLLFSLILVLLFLIFLMHNYG